MAWQPLGGPAGPDGPAPAVTGVTLSSHRVVPGDLYAALPAPARTAPTSSATRSRGAPWPCYRPGGRGPRPARNPGLLVEQPRAVLGELSAQVYGHPARALRTIAVTGTQGKTTTTRLAEQALLAAGVATGVIGTVGTRIDGRDIRTALTTPEAPDLHGLFARMVEEGVQACALEVSSHALVLGRVDGAVFDLACFTNLGRDHLDFHADVEDYFAAKASLFTPARARRGLVSVDDDYGRRLLDEAAVPVRTFSARGGTADWQAVDVRLEATGSRFTVVGPDGASYDAVVPLPGAFNVANALAAIAACAEVGYAPDAVVAGVAASAGVPGRLERVEGGQDFVVVVDYAHKPDAVKATLATLRPLTAGRLWVVLGAGGDRDAGKRPLMGELAAAGCDVLIVTDDNPRSEDPAAIRAAVLAGARGRRAEVLEIGDRRQAIREAVGRAGPGDVVLIAGKGHETGQEVAGAVHPFDDRAVAAEELAAR
ncbi:MAG: UDP-N-acetylmuramoyl-L-alanyl-D-glutamate--2,6-diaminopimelate ligase [Nocardioides sp.]